MATIVYFSSSFAASAPPLPRLGSVRRLPRAAAFATSIQAKIREVFMPALSSTMTEGKIVSWLRSEGDKIRKGESVVVVESDKADMDVETFYDGYMAAIVADEGSVAAVGSAIALIAETEEEIAEARSRVSSPSSSDSCSRVEEISDESSRVCSSVGSKSTIEDEKIAGPTIPTITPTTATISTAHPASQGGSRVVASPYAKKLAKDLTVDLAGVLGTGPSGRILAKDVENAAASTLPKLSEVKPTSPPPAKESASAGTNHENVLPFTTIQSAISRNMVDSLRVPTFRVGYTIVTDLLDSLYKKVKCKGVTMSALLVKASALALRKHPIMNAYCIDGHSFGFNTNINIAVAVAMDGGLITPVLHDADKVDVYSLSRKWTDLVTKARAKQLQPHEYTTGTFTISNLGMLGVDRFDAILPARTGAIMAVGASRMTVSATEDRRIGVRNEMKVNVTADHRIIYGADLAAFLKTLAGIIENPADLTL